MCQGFLILTVGPKTDSISFNVHTYSLTHSLILYSADPGRPGGYPRGLGALGGVDHVQGAKPLLTYSYTVGTLETEKPQSACKLHTHGPEAGRPRPPLMYTHLKKIKNQQDNISNRFERWFQ